MNLHRRSPWIAPASSIVIATFLASIALLAASPAAAHCDGRDGPVVTASVDAIRSGDLARSLIWVKPEMEPAVREAFTRATAAAAGQGPAARSLAEEYFAETVVRLHRTGEGAPYTGLKPAGRDLGPAIPAADRALETGDLDDVEALLLEAVAHGLRERFERARAARSYATADVAAGRAYVSDYVAWVHYVQGIYRAAAGVGAHGAEAAAPSPHAHDE